MSEPEPLADAQRDDAASPPPFLGTWGRVYGALLTLLALYIGLGYALSMACQ